MAQAAYISQDSRVEPTAVTALVEPALAVSLFADSPAMFALLAEDAASAGMALRERRSLESLLEGGAGVLGDVVLVDCPQVDAARMAALMRLDERAARSGAMLVVSTSFEALDEVFACLDTSDPQILVAAGRAERLVALGSALAKLPGSRLRELEEGDRVALLRLTEEVGRLAAKIDGLSPIGTAPGSARLKGEGTGRLAQPTLGFRHAERQAGLERKPRPPLPSPRLVKAIIRHRTMRGEFFDAGMFADPAWDILLDLTAARAEHRRVSVTSLCIAANVPATTALRWISQMVEANILVRVEDESDKRRAFIELSDKAADAMARYFDAIGTGATAV
jgi:hypothetical protein